MKRLRLWLAWHLLMPYWLPTLEHYDRLIEEGETEEQRRNCTYISIGMRYVLMGKEIR